MLAAAGLARVAVARRPKLAVIATGDEIVEPGERKRPGQIRNANGPALTAMAAEAGAEAVYLGIARDRRSSLRPRSSAGPRGPTSSSSPAASRSAITTWSRDELEASGVRPVFWQVRIKPGKPVFFGVRGRQLVFGLPGNPTSAMVTFLLFVRPAVDRMLGRAVPGPAAGRAVLALGHRPQAGADAVPARRPRRAKGPGLKVAPYTDQKSGVLRSMVRSRVLIVVPADVSRIEAGREVEILFMDGR